MKIEPMTREEWRARNPGRNPDTLTPFGPAWTLTDQQQATLNAEIDREEARQWPSYSLAGYPLTLC